MAARGRIHTWKCFSPDTIIRVAGCLLIVLGLLLCISIFISPALLCKTFLDSKLSYSAHGLDHGSMKENPNIAYDHIIVQERRFGASMDDPKRFTLLIGVMTMASKIDRRNLLRLAYVVQSSPDAHISVRFIIGGFEEVGLVEKTLIGMENATYRDIIALNCTENLNEGKTFTFFSSLPDLGVEYDYVMKTDDDSYIRFENLGKSLKLLPRTDLYYGYILPCENQDPYSWYMAGMGYLISWDLVLWIRDSAIPRNKSVGTEDQLVGDWFNEGGVAKHRVNEKPLFYDHPEFGGSCAHELVLETILVHQVKTPERWADVLSFFEKDRISRALPLAPKIRLKAFPHGQILVYMSCMRCRQGHVQKVSAQIGS